MSLRLFFTINVLFVSIGICAQSVSLEVVNTAGGYYANTNNSILFSVGETAITSISGTSGILSQGFLQSKPSLLELTENESQDNLLIYPNPASDLIFFKGLENKESNTIHVLDRLGKVIYKGDLKNQYFDVSPYAEGVYQIVIYDDKENILHRKTFFKFTNLN